MVKTEIISIFLLLCLVEISLAQRFESTVVNGTNSTRGEFPYAVLLLRGVSNENPFAGFFCGGSILTEQFVITAAHCVSSQRQGSFYVRAGVVNAKQQDDEYSAIIKSRNHTRHPQYGRYPATRYDFAIVKLQTAFVFNQYVNAVKLAKNATEMYVNRLATIVGWGRLWFRGNISQHQQKAPQLIVSQENCGAVWNNITLEHVCTRWNYTGPCHGDSGGPLIVDEADGPVLVGLTSWGYECARDYPHVFARVSAASEWIDSIIAED